MTIHSAKKSLGQNFLIDKNVAGKIVGSLRLTEHDRVLEIGPGKGALTKLIALRGCELQAIEKDIALAEDLRLQFEDNPRVAIICGDFLKHDFETTRGRVKVVGNIPYNLTSDIVSMLVDCRDRIEFAVVMVQDEVASRFSAHHGTKEYGAISVRLQLVGEVERLFLVHPTCFRPMPKVNSRVIRISFSKSIPLQDEPAFVAFIKKAFGMRRKMFRHFVSHFYGKEFLLKLEEKWQTRRVETFSPEEIYRLFLLLENHIDTF